MSKEHRFWFRKVRYRFLDGKEGVREAYDTMAVAYDYSGYLYWTRKMEEAEERVLLKWIDHFSGICLDVGCGTGRYSLRVAQNGVEVVAVDLSLKMLKMLKSKENKYGSYERVNLVLADGEHLPLRNKVFNALICALAFDHFVDCDRAAREFSRILRDRSLCVLSVFNRRTAEDFQKRYGFGSKVPFQTENMSPVLIFEVGHSADNVEEVFSRYGLKAERIKGCCYWHISPLFEACYPFRLDDLLNLLDGMLKYAEIHAILMVKR